jgi:regulatory protein
MTITSIEKTKANKMVRVYIDNQYAFTIPYEEYIKNNICENEEIDQEKILNIRNNVLINSAKLKAVRYLTIKDRSEGEVRKKLLDSGFDSDVVKKTINELKSLGYLDDTRFTMRYLADRGRTKALSKKALRMELKRKKIPDDIINMAFSEYEADDEEIALRAARKKYGKYDISDKKVQERIFRFLRHRGFSTEIILKVIKSMKYIIL